MYLEQITILNFKNLESVELTLSSGVCGIVGDNGAGKSNILDSIHYLSTARSMLSTSDQQSIRRGAGFFLLDGKYMNDSGFSDYVSCSYSRVEANGASKKILKRNGKEYDKLSDHVGQFPIVVVSPHDHTLISDSAEERRRFFNMLISQFDYNYLNALIRYNALLVQRNKVLKEGGSEEMLSIYDQQILPYSQMIHNIRREVVELLSPRVAAIYEQLSCGRERVSMEYRSQLNTCDYESMQLQSRQRDIVMGYTNCGVHRDDILFTIDGELIRRFGSQGQQKSFLIALKLAQYQLYGERKGELPILLLDDLFDKLDRGRVEQLIRLVAGDGFGQIIISDCNQERLHTTLVNAAVEYSIFSVEHGSVSQQIDSNEKN
ncbi:MAG: DNA replication and repair protein RecF [Rikenellaceae bacterium]